ncbi:ATP-dependent helicase [Sulfurimicrobium lacus]|uniref:ATP-dependent helicase n=1 Tax=Sulfurimicrobium lacus TaxID=2715678 RepID=A0A6F8V9Q5_9PROT|nr:ATP-dependent RNA helicase HrpA [Sulfurimicrobium lacus]BCB25847.1 ATP-dependent helicase [Sulfurimicrobium lacus]
MPSNFRALSLDIANCMQRDRHRFVRELNKIENALRSGKAPEAALADLGARIRASAARRASRLERIPTPTFAAELPVNEKRHDIAAAIAANQVVIVCGETGSGKTTQLPQICLDLKRGAAGLIGHTQPRRIAARSVAARISAELKSELGQAVGYQVRFHDRVSENNYIKVMTDGILLAETQGDRFLDAYDTLIIDEAHERSLNIDFLLGYLKRILPRRPDLKVIITSATIDAERFSRHFDGAPVIEVSGRMYPVEMRYRPLAEEENGSEADLEVAILHAVDEIAGHGGDILIFLPGEREIREVAEALRKHHPPGAEILPLYSRLSNAEQDRVFKPGGGRRIVLATNVAETSLTVPGIRYVIDPGYARIRRYSVRAKVERLQVEKISRASASQRAGRCGRVASGICIRLYDEEDFNTRPAFTDPEIRRSNLAAVILRMQALGLGAVEDFPFLEAPDPRAISDGFQLLEELGAVDEARTLTPLGKQLAQLPIDPRIARMILAAHQENSLSEALVIASALTVQDPRERPLAAQEAADTAHRRFQDERSDFLGFIKLWRFYDEALVHKKSNRKLTQHCYDNFLSAMRMREWRDVHGQLAVMVKEMGMRPNEIEADYAQIHRALLAGLLGNIGLKSEGREYLGARGIKFSIFPGSVLFKPSSASKEKTGGAGPKWLMAGELTETTRLYGRTLARIEPEWIEPLAGHLIKRNYFDPHWEKKASRVSAYERVTLYGLVIEPKRKVHYGPISPTEARGIFIRAALVEGEYVSNAPFFKHNRKLVEDIEELEHKARRQDILVDEQRIFDFYDQLIPQGIHNGAAFDKWRREAERSNPRRLFLTREQLMRHEAGHVTEDLFPPSLQLSGGEYPLTYRFEHGHPLDGVTITIPLAALNQISAARCEWLVPGLLREKITWFIRGLPHKLRSACVPVPEFVTAALGKLNPADRPLTRDLGFFIKAAKGIDIPAEAWANDTVPEHLRMNFRVIDGDNRELASSRDLEKLRSELGGQAEQSFGAALTSDFERDGITAWDFGDLPDKVEFQRHAQTLVGYPALVDQEGGVALRLFDTPAKAELAMRMGLARLLLLQLPEQARFLEKSLPINKATCLHYLPIGTCDELKRDLQHAIAEHVLIGDKPVVHTAAQFAQRRDESRPLLVSTTNQTCKLVADILAEYHAVAQKLQAAKVSPSAISDMKEQLGQLVYLGFLAQTPMNWLRHYPRYLKAMALRLDKLPHAANRDSQLQAELAPFWRRYLDAMLQLEKRGATPSPELSDYRWMIEELRVSLFAQELKTIQPISTKRLEKQWENTIRQVSAKH